MNTSILPHPATALALALLLSAPLVVHAQNAVQRAKGTLQLPTRPSETSAIPSGVDGGTSATSNSVPLGTPTTPANARERDELKKASAAARAAARPRAAGASAPLAAAAGTTGAAATTTGASVNGNAAARSSTIGTAASGVSDCVAAAAAAGSGARSAGGVAPGRADKRAGCR